MLKGPSESGRPKSILQHAVLSRLWGITQNRNGWVGYACHKELGSKVFKMLLLCWIIRKALYQRGTLRICHIINVNFIATHPIFLLNAYLLAEVFTKLLWIRDIKNNIAIPVWTLFVLMAFFIHRSVSFGNAYIKDLRFAPTLFSMKSTLNLQEIQSSIGDKISEENLQPCPPCW